MRKYIFLLPMLFLICCAPPAAPLAETQFLLGTTCTIKLYTGQSQQTLDKAFGRITEIEQSASINIEGSQMSKINLAAGKEAVSVNNDVFAIIKKGIYYSESSGGVFDISIGPLVNLWHIGFDDARIPSQIEIDAALAKIGYKDIQVNETEATVFLKHEGMALDPGAIAKGYAADAVVSVLRENDVTSAIVDLGGDIHVIGKNAGKPWRVGIQSPTGGIVGVVSCADTSIVTSGTYERRLESADANYHHILNPFTGYPYDNGLASVTILSENAIDGDGLATAAFAKGLDGGMEFVRSNGAEAIFITTDGYIHLTDGLSDNFELTGNGYRLAGKE